MRLGDMSFKQEETTTDDPTKSLEECDTTNNSATTAGVVVDPSSATFSFDNLHEYRFVVVAVQTYSNRSKNTTMS